MSEDRSAYISFLLRLWRSKAEEKTHWRAYLEEVDSGKQYGFNTLADLFQFLDLLTDTAGTEVDQEYPT